MEIIILRLLGVNTLTPSKRACRPVRYFAITNHISTLETSTRHLKRISELILIFGTKTVSTGTYLLTKKALVTYSCNSS